MNLGLYDVSLNGHHGVYLISIARAALSFGWNVKIVLPKSARTHPLADKLSSLLPEGNLLFSPYEAAPIKRFSAYSLILHHLEQFRVARRSIPLLRGCDFIYYCNLDYMDKAMSLLGPPSRTIPSGGMRMRVDFHLRRLEDRKAKATMSDSFAEASLMTLTGHRNLRLITTADPILTEMLKPRKSSYKLKHVPEIGMVAPKLGREEARKRLSLPLDKPVLLIYGALTARKGIREALAACSLLNPSPVLLIMGKAADQSTIEYLSSPEVRSGIDSGQIFVYQQFVDAELESAAFAAATLVWIAYVNHLTMSGVFFQAMCSGRPVIAPQSGILKWMTDQYGVGISVNPLDHQNTAYKIQQLLSDRERQRTLSESALSRAHQHTPEAFGTAICKAIDAALRN